VAGPSSGVQGFHRGGGASYTGEVPDDALEILPIRPDDAGETLTLQRAAFVQEALIYDSVQMPPLTQTLDELRAELVENLGCVARENGRMLGAVRARADGDLLLVGRLAIAPDVQGRGIGSRLLEAVEQRGRDAGCRESELFTGSLSEANLRLYERTGYRETTRVQGDDGIEQVFLRKPLG
jgi:GNAT superfamily N-acetyltransferase